MLRLIETKVDRKIQLILRTFHTRSYYLQKLLCAQLALTSWWDIKKIYKNVLRSYFFLQYSILIIKNLTFELVEICRRRNYNLNKPTFTYCPAVANLRNVDALMVI